MCHQLKIHACTHIRTLYKQTDTTQHTHYTHTDTHYTCMHVHTRTTHTDTHYTCMHAHTHTTHTDTDTHTTHLSFVEHLLDVGIPYFGRVLVSTS